MIGPAPVLSESPTSGGAVLRWIDMSTQTLLTLAPDGGLTSTELPPQSLLLLSLPTGRCWRSPHRVGTVRAR